MSTNPQWYMAVGGHQVGPVSEDEIVSNIKNGSADASTLVFTAGMDNWTALKDVDRFRVHLRSSAPKAPAPPPVPGRRAHEIDFNIVGEDLQSRRVVREASRAQARCRRPRASFRRG